MLRPHQRSLLLWLACFGVGLTVTVACVGDDPSPTIAGDSPDGGGSSGASGGASSGASGGASSGASGGASSGASGTSGGPFALAVKINPTAVDGRITSTPAGIDCGTTCTGTFPPGTSVTLAATPAGPNGFLGWLGDGASCGVGPTCAVTMDAAKKVGGLFPAKSSIGWLSSISSTGGDGGALSAIDKDGNVFVAVGFSASFVFQGKTYNTSGASDVWLAKLSPAGEVLWSKVLGGSGDDVVSALAVNRANGDVVIAGIFNSPTINLGGAATLANSTVDGDDLFVAKLSGAGTAIWQKPINASDVDQPNVGAVALDAAGNVFLTGDFNTSIDFGGAGNSLTSADHEGYLVKLDTGTGAVLLKHAVGGSSAGIAMHAMVVDSTGDAIVGGEFGGTMTNPNLTSTGASTDGWIAKFSGVNLNTTWSKLLGGSGEDRVNGLTLVGGAADAIAVALDYSCINTVAATFAGASIGSCTSTSFDIVVGRFSNAGIVDWAKRYQSASNDHVSAIATLADASIAITGNISGNLTMDATTLVYGGTATDSFFAVLDGAVGPTATWAFKVGSVNSDLGRSVTGKGKLLYGFGNYTGTGTFLGQDLPNGGGTDAYMFGAVIP